MRSTSTRARAPGRPVVRALVPAVLGVLALLVFPAGGAPPPSGSAATPPRAASTVSRATSADTISTTAGDLRAAIAAASSGAEIRVTGGVLVGPLVVDRTVRIVGLGRPIIDGRNEGTVVRLVAPGTHFSGMVVRRSGASLLTDDAAILVTADDVTVADVDIEEALHGIYLLRASGFRLLNNRIRGKPWINDENRGNGIHAHVASGGTIAGNDIALVRDGVYFNYADRNLIENNRASHLRYGLHYMWSNDNRFAGNEFTESVGGAAIMYSRRIVFERNTFARQRGFRAHGVLFKDVERCRAIGNRILDNSEGITLDGAVGNRFEGNLVAGNDAAVVEYGNSEGNVFAGNAFVGNGTDLREIGQESSSRWDENGRGNYWSSYDGYDLDADGIGDAPHRLQNLFEYLEGERPILRVLAHGPGATAVRLAERAFPVLRQRDTVDRRPLMQVPTAIRRQEAPKVTTSGRGRLASSASFVLGAGVLLVILGRRR